MVFVGFYVKTAGQVLEGGASGTTAVETGDAVAGKAVEPGAGLVDGGVLQGGEVAGPYFLEEAGGFVSGDAVTDEGG